MKEIFWMLVFFFLCVLLLNGGFTVTIDGTPHSIQWEAK